MFEELLLQRMQRLAMRHALDRLDLAPLYLGAEHQAGTNEAAIEDHTARPAVTRRTAFFAAGQGELIAQHVQQSFVPLAQELDLVAIDGCSNVILAHALSPARAWAICAARRARTPATLIR